MTDALTADALESKSVLEWDGKDMSVKSDAVEQEA